MRIRRRTPESTVSPEAPELRALIPAADTGMDEWVRLHCAIDALELGHIKSFSYPLVGGGHVTFSKRAK